MFHARSMDVRTGELSEKPVYPSAHARALRGDAAAGDHLVFFDFQSGDPLEFHAGATYERKGHPREKRPHYQRMEGYGLANPDRRRSRAQGFAKFATASKALMVIDSVSPDFAYKARALDFSGEQQSKYCLDLHKWIALNRGQFFTSRVQSARDAVLTIHALKGRYQGVPGGFKDLCFAAYNGGVEPYERFFFGWHNAKIIARSQHRLTQLYNDLSRGKDCALVTSEAGARTDPNRAVGLPVLLHFVPTRSTLDPHGPGDLHGNLTPLEDRGGHIITALHVSDALKKSHGQEVLRRMVLQAGNRGLYVLGTPVVTYDPATAGAKPVHGQREWHSIRFVLNDLVRQTFPVGAASQDSQNGFAPVSHEPPSAHAPRPPAAATLATATLWDQTTPAVA